VRLLGALIIAAVVVTLLIITLSNGTNSSEQANNAPKPEKAVIYYPRIEEATWGKNCHGKPVKNILGVPDQNKFYQIKKNNLLKHTQSLCNKKPLCVIQLDDKHMPFDPAPFCLKDLEIKYRCFNFDALHTAMAYRGEPVTIDCQPEKDGDADG